jgi:nucleoside-diphosphate-sugar epimerase
VILVTGGSGFVGLNLAEQLLGRGESVALFSATPAPASAIAELSRLPGKLSVLEGDVSDFPSVKNSFEKLKPQRVIHAAAVTAGAERDAREPRRIAEVNLLGTLNVLQGARDAGVRRFVHASTGAVFGAAGMGAAAPLDEERDRPVPESLYGITKYAAERAVLRLGTLWKLDVVAGRLAVVFGRWEYATGVRDTLAAPTVIARMARQGAEAVFPALGECDYIYGPDVAAALIALLDAKSPRHRLYHLGTGAPWSLPQWCAALEKRHPGFRWRESANANECNVSVLPSVGRTPFSNRRLAQELGYAPRYDLAAAAADFTSWLGEHHDF